MMTRFEVGGWNTDADTDGLSDSLFGQHASAHVSMYAYLDMAYNRMASPADPHNMGRSRSRHVSESVEQIMLTE